MDNHTLTFGTFPAVIATLVVLATLAIGSTSFAKSPETKPATGPSKTEKARVSAAVGDARPSSDAKPTPDQATAKAPEVFKARFKTTKGDYVVEVRRKWSPNGADRFYNLVRLGYGTDLAYFRVLKGFMAQTGIHGTPDISALWRGARIQDDPPAGQSNTRGFVSYATAGPHTRTTQFFVNYGDNANLDSMGFTPFGQVVDGMKTVEALYGDYGEGAPRGTGPDQGRVQMEGNAYLKKEFPKLDYIKSAAIEK